LGSSICVPPIASCAQVEHYRRGLEHCSCKLVDFRHSSEKEKRRKRVQYTFIKNFEIDKAFGTEEKMVSLVHNIP
jgi:hypothetical protein